MVRPAAGESVMGGEVALCAGDPASVTRTVKLNWPVPVGVPLMVPVAAFSVSPGGRLPVATAKL